MTEDLPLVTICAQIIAIAADNLFAQSQKMVFPI